MRREDVLEFLERVFAQFRLAPGFLDALSALITGSGYELAFFKLLMIRLRVLQVLGVTAVRQKEFESLSGSELFSMHLSSKGFNIRILYGFLPDREPVLLLPFYERAGKATTDYSSRVNEASELFRREKERYENGTN